MLLPDSVIVPVPVLVNASLLVAPSLMVPPNVVELLSPPDVSVASLAPLLVTVPPPAPLPSEPMVLLKPLRSSVAPTLTVNAEFCASPVTDPAFSVPESTFVVPL